MGLNTELTSLKEEINQLNKEAENKAKKGIYKSATHMFNSYPGLEKIIWSQYTPSFSDGDPCYFSINTPSFIFAAKHIEDDEDLDEDEDNCPYLSPPSYAYEEKEYYKDWVDQWEQLDVEKRNLYTNYAEDTHSLRTFLSKLGNILMRLYGDGVKVTITRRGVEIIDYYKDL